MKKTKSTTIETKEKLREAFWQLYREKGIEKITIKEITDLAGYNRSTFYVHYQDVYHVLEEIEQEIMISFKQMQPHISSIMLSQNNFQDQLLFFRQFYEQNIKYLSVFLHQNKNATFIHQVKEMMKNELLLSLTEHKPASQATLEHLLEYIISAHIGLFSYWLGENSSYTFEEILNLVNEVSFNGPFTLLAKQLQ